MLILTLPAKSRARKACCGNCTAGKPCCGTKAKPRPAFEKHRGLWLPRRDLTLPKNLLQFPSEAEWSGLWRPWLPALTTFDLSCLACCGDANCCTNNSRLVDNTISVSGTVSSACAAIDGCQFTMGGGAGACPNLGSDENLGEYVGGAGCGDVGLICIYCTGDAWTAIVTICAMLPTQQAAISGTVNSCDPLSITFSGTLSDGGPCCTTGDAISFTVSE